MLEPVQRKPIVWLVDDSPLERALALKALGGDYAFEQFGDGSEVVERLGSGGGLPDVILLDWVMPGMSGEDVCRYVRTHESISDLSIILFTASRIDTQDVVKGFALGANDYVPKPFVPEELRARVLSVLRSKELRETATRERSRLAMINRLGRALFAAGPDVTKILQELVGSLRGTLADGCAILLIPGDLEPLAFAMHRSDPDGAGLAQIAMLADPMTIDFASSEDALAKLPPLYHPYIRRFGLRGLSILPFPIRDPVQGVVTLTRDGGSQPFHADDVAAIETCIEYTSLAVQNALRFETERAARAQVAAVLEHAPIGIVVAELDGRIKLVNPAAVRMISGIEHAETQDAVVALGTWSTMEGEPITRESWATERDLDSSGRRQMVFQPPTGIACVLSLTTVTRHQVDQLSGTVTSIEDVTAQHTMAMERERVAAFQEQMLGIVGHDLRNPLNAIVTGAELILEYAKDMPKIRSVVARVQSSSRRMTSIVNQLLDVTRARLGDGIPLALGEVVLGVLAQSVLEELTPSYPAARFELTADDVHGVWDADRLAQVISNLMSNAAQYGGVGAPIQIAAMAEGDQAVLTVTNALREAPIPADRLAQLFEPYRRGESSAAAHRAGLGLGLYIAHEVVRAHKGRLSATSTSEGTTFRVELPLHPG